MPKSRGWIGGPFRGVHTPEPAWAACRGLVEAEIMGPHTPELEAVALGEASTGSQAVRILVTGATFENPLL